MGQRGQKVTRPPLVWGDSSGAPICHQAPFGRPLFHFLISGGGSAPLGSGNAPHPPSPSVPTGVVALEAAVPPRRGTWPHGGGGLSPKAGGRGGATVASVSPPLHVPPPQPPILGHFRPRPAKCHPKVGGER